MTEDLVAIPPTTLNIRRLLWQTLVAILVFGGVLLLLGTLFKDELLGVSRWFVETLGGPGVMLGFFLPDAFALPLPHEAFLTFALIGKLDFWEISAWASAGSLVGGTVGFNIGRYLTHTRWVKAFLTRHGRRAGALIERYGLVALALGALTPLPYSIMCWICGALQMKFGPFILVSLLRIPRVIFYLWLIELGVVHVIS